VRGLGSRRGRRWRRWASPVVDSLLDDEGAFGGEYAGFERAVGHGVGGQEGKVGLLVEEVGGEGGIFGTMAQERAGEVGLERAEGGEGMGKGVCGGKVSEDGRVTPGEGKEWGVDMR
jgi:hypothetical protein